MENEEPERTLHMGEADPAELKEIELRILRLGSATLYASAMMAEHNQEPPRPLDHVMSGIHEMLMIAAGAPEWFMECVQLFEADHEGRCEVTLHEHALDAVTRLLAFEKDPELAKKFEAAAMQKMTGVLAARFQKRGIPQEVIKGAVESILRGEGPPDDN